MDITYKSKYMNIKINKIYFHRKMTNSFSSFCLLFIQKQNVKIFTFQVSLIGNIAWPATLNLNQHLHS